MRIVAIGLGGAGCRIVDRLYASDRRSSKVACVQGLAVDVDEPTLKNLAGLPEQGRLFFPPLDLSVSNEQEASAGPTATIDIHEIVAKVQNLQSGETDAVIIFCGLGGSMVDIAPHIIAGLRSSLTEPIFGLLTLPCLAEGERKSSKAADDIDVLQPLLDGIILFDNETWYRKIKAEKAHLTKKQTGFAEKLGIKKSEQDISPVQATYALLNDGIVRRISLILRAGEFKADGGIDLAEVVLDSGEVLNTMKGMGFITIGYAVERLPPDPLGFLSRFKSTGIFNEEQKKKASRIIELAKQAIYHEVSTPCDMTSAHKALVLIAGPSHELSMKGFMTVRKWIDRSIAGLETRSGDYPVMNTKNVAIIVMLSGLENIPRLTEIRDIRSQFLNHARREKADVNASVAAGSWVRENAIGISGTAVTDSATLSHTDEMIALPPRDPASEKSPRQSPISRESPVPFKAARMTDITDESTRSTTRLPPVAGPIHDMPGSTRSIGKSPGSHGDVHFRPGERTDESPGKEREILSRRLIVSRGTTEHTSPKKIHTAPPQGATGISPGHGDGGIKGSEQGTAANKVSHRPERVAIKGRESDRQRIERELQRQRELAIPGSGKIPSGHVKESTRTVPVVHRKSEDALPEPSEKEFERTNDDTGQARAGRTVVVSRKSQKTADEDPGPQIPYAPVADSGERKEEEDFTEKSGAENTVAVRGSAFKAKDGIFEGQPTRRAVIKPQARDSSLIHTDISGKKRKDDPGNEHGNRDRDPDTSPPGSGEPGKKEKVIPKDEDFSWV